MNEYFEPDILGVYVLGDVHILALQRGPSGIVSAFTDSGACTAGA